MVRKVNFNMKFPISICIQNFIPFPFFSFQEDTISVEVLSDSDSEVEYKTKESIPDEEKSHSSTEHTDAKKPYACKQCDQSFNHASNLSRHKKTIHEKKHSFACDQCYKIFTQSCHLKTHKNNVHEGIRSQLCGLCGKSFQNAPLLKRHLLSHTGLYHKTKATELPEPFFHAYKM